MARVSVLLTILGLLTAVSGAQAKIPSVANSTIPTRLVLVGCGAEGAPDSTCSSARLVVRDIANNPEPECSIVLDFSQCPDCRIGSLPESGALQTDCAGPYVRGHANLEGTIDLRVAGASTGIEPVGADVVRLFADGVLLGTLPVITPDLDGRSGLTINDLSIVLGDMGAPEYRGRSDMDGSGSLGPNDISVWLGWFARGTSVLSAANLCP